MCGMNKLTLDIFSSLDVKCVTPITKWGMRKGLRQRIAGCKSYTDPIHVVSRSTRVPESQVLTCSEVTVLTTESYRNKLVSLIVVFLFSLCCNWKSLPPVFHPMFSSAWHAGRNPIHKNWFDGGKK